MKFINFQTLKFLYHFIPVVLQILFKHFKLKMLMKQGDEEKIYKYAEKMAMRTAEAMVKGSGCNLTIVGRENIPEGGVLFVGNHESMFDVPILLHSYGKGIGFITKYELSKIITMSDWMKAEKCIFIDRSNLRQSITVINEGIEQLNNGYTMAIFPEGTRNKGQVGEFKKGSLRLATKTKVPIVPVMIKGSRGIFENNSENFYLSRIKKVDVKISFLKPIYASDYSQDMQKELASIVENLVKEEYKRL